MAKRYDETELPPPVTPRSSKADLWEELECVRNEVDSINSEVVALREKCARLEGQLRGAQWQIDLARSVLSAGFIAA